MFDLHECLAVLKEDLDALGALQCTTDAPEEIRILRKQGEDLKTTGEDYLQQRSGFFSPLTILVFLYVAVSVCTLFIGALLYPELAAIFVPLVALIFALSGIAGIYIVALKRSIEKDYEIWRKEVRSFHTRADDARVI